MELPDVEQMIERGAESEWVDLELKKSLGEKEGAMKTLREVLANAFAHRDYAHAGGSVHVAIFSDRVEVTNPGTLPMGMSVEDLLVEHESKPRNPLIAKVFFRRKLIDEWGRGTRSVVRLCRNAGHPDGSCVPEEPAGSRPS